MSICGRLEADWARHMFWKEAFAVLRIEFELAHS